MIVDSLPSNKSKEIQAGNFDTRVSALLSLKPYSCCRPHMPICNSVVTLHGNDMKCHSPDCLRFSFLWCRLAILY